MATVKRSKLLHYMNTTPESSATYNLMNTGITNLSISKNPTYLEEGYIADEVGTKVLESLAPEFSFEINVDSADEVSKFLTKLEWEDKTLSDTHTDIITVKGYGTNSGTDEAPIYPAKKYAVSVAVETVGDEALKTLKHSVKCGVRGDAVYGTFAVVAKTFTPA